jgi:hypothetical protein
MTPEITLLRANILDLIKFACKRARQHNHDKHHSIGIRAWGYDFLHSEAIMYVRELIWIYRQAGEK